MESICYVFFLEQRPPQLGSFVSQVVGQLQRIIELPTATIAASSHPNADASLADARWKPSRGGVLQLSLPRSRFRTSAVSFLAELPDDVSEISVDSPVPGTKRPAFELTWGMQVFAAPSTKTTDYEETYATDGVLDSTVAIEFSSEFFDRIGEDARAHVTTWLLHSIASLGSCYYGFCECEDADASNGLWLYSRAKMEPVARHMIEREQSWWDLGPARRTKVKYVHWGTLLGRPMAQLLQSSRPTILSELRDWHWSPHPQDPTQRGDNQVIELPDGGLFLSLTGDVMHSSTQSGWMRSFGNRGSQCASLLRKRFREAGILA